MNEHVQVVIPFRDRGTDPLRPANLERVFLHWLDDHHTTPLITDDGRMGAQQFNRSAAYNRGIAAAPSDVEVFVFAESDMLVGPDQIDEAIRMAKRDVGLVVPFTQYRYLSPQDSTLVRTTDADPARMAPAWTMDNGRSIGALGVISRETMELVGQWDERFEGNWYDDNAMHIAFEVCAAHTRFVHGPAYHLHHLSGNHGNHLTPEDRRATLRNKQRLGHYQFAARTEDSDRIRALTAGSK